MLKHWLINLAVEVARGLLPDQVLQSSRAVALEDVSFEYAMSEVENIMLLFIASQIDGDCTLGSTRGGRFGI